MKNTSVYALALTAALASGCAHTPKHQSNTHKSYAPKSNHQAKVPTISTNSNTYSLAMPIKSGALELIIDGRTAKLESDYFTREGVTYHTLVNTNAMSTNEFPIILFNSDNYGFRTEGGEVKINTNTPVYVGNIVSGLN